MAEKKSDLERVRAMLEQAHKDGDLSAEDLVKQMQLLDEKNTAEIEAFIRYQKQHGRKQKNKKGGMTASVPPEKNRKDQKAKEKRVLPRSREDDDNLYQQYLDDYVTGNLMKEISMEDKKDSEEVVDSFGFEPGPQWTGKRMRKKKRKRKRRASSSDQELSSGNSTRPDAVLSILQNTAVSEQFTEESGKGQNLSMQTDPSGKQNVCGTPEIHMESDIHIYPYKSVEAAGSDCSKMGSRPDQNRTFDDINSENRLHFLDVAQNGLAAVDTYNRQTLYRNLEKIYPDAFPESSPADFRNQDDRVEAEIQNIDLMENRLARQESGEDQRSEMVLEHSQIPDLDIVLPNSDIKERMDSPLDFTRESDSMNPGKVFEISDMEQRKPVSGADYNIPKSKGGKRLETDLYANHDSIDFGRSASCLVGSLYSDGENTSDLNPGKTYITSSADSFPADSGKHTVEIGIQNTDLTKAQSSQQNDADKNREETEDTDNLFADDEMHVKANSEPQNAVFLVKKAFDSCVEAGNREKIDFSQTARPKGLQQTKKNALDFLKNGNTPEITPSATDYAAISGSEDTVHDAYMLEPESDGAAPDPERIEEIHSTDRYSSVATDRNHPFGDRDSFSEVAHSAEQEYQDSGMKLEEENPDECSSQSQNPGDGVSSGGKSMSFHGRRAIPEQLKKRQTTEKHAQEQTENPDTGEAISSQGQDEAVRISGLQENCIFRSGIETGAVSQEHPDSDVLRQKRKECRKEPGDSDSASQNAAAISTNHMANENSGFVLLKGKTSSESQASQEHDDICFTEEGLVSVESESPVTTLVENPLCEDPHEDPIVFSGMDLEDRESDQNTSEENPEPGNPISSHESLFHPAKLEPGSKASVHQSDDWNTDKKHETNHLIADMEQERKDSCATEEGKAWEERKNTDIQGSDPEDSSEMPDVSRFSDAAEPETSDAIHVTSNGEEEIHSERGNDVERESHFESDRENIGGSGGIDRGSSERYRNQFPNTKEETGSEEEEEDWKFVSGRYQPSGIEFRIAGLTKSMVSGAGTLVYRHLASGDSTKRTLDSTQRLSFGIAAAMISRVRRRMARAQQAEMVRKLNPVLKKLKLAPLTWQPRTLRDLNAIQKELNGVLRRYGYSPVRGSGFQMQIIIAKMLKKGGLPGEVEDALKALQLIAKNKALLEKVKYKGFWYLAGSRFRYYARQWEAGEGIFLTAMMIRTARTTLRLGLTAMRSVSSAARLAGKFAYRQSLKAALKLSKMNAKTEIGNTVKAGASKAVKGAETASRYQDAADKKIRQFKAPFEEASEKIDRFTREPFGARSKAYHVRQTICSRIRNAIPEPVKKNKAVKTAGRLISKLAAVCSGFSAALQSMKMMIFALLGIILLLIFLVVLLGAVIIELTSVFDATSFSEAKRNVILQEVKDCYEKQIGDIEAMYDRYDAVNLIFNDIRDTDSYGDPEHTCQSAFIETTNSAEILSMALVYFQFDIDEVSDEELKTYARQLYNASHQLTVKTESEVIGYTEEEEAIEKVTATVTLTTYYFDRIFDCILTDSYSTINGISGSNTELSVWLYFTGQGFSEEATAGIMGNIYQESKFDPALIQGNGRGPAAGLFQWENYNQKSGRWLKMSEFAAAQGKDWTDLGAQLHYAMTEIPGELSTYGSRMGLEAFQNLTDIAQATEEFERAFERAGKPVMSTRITAAYGYYDQFHGITASGSDIVDYALQFVGNPYVYGGDDMTNGIDCSHFVYHVLKNTGHYSGGYVTSTNWAGLGTAVSSLDQALPGDVIVWEGHVAIYMGNGQIVHAANPSPYPKGGVKISKISDQTGSLGNYIAIRRFTK